MQRIYKGVAEIVTNTASDAGAPPTTPLKSLDFQDLRKAIDAKVERASKPEVVASWNQLGQVVRDLEGGLDDDDVVSWILGRRWALTNVMAAGFRGILNDEELVIDLDPRAGVTVFHGANGAGKSSIADAIVAALTGGLDLVKGSGGRTPLWEPIPYGRGSLASSAKVTLTSEGANLVLHYKQPNAAATPVWECNLVREGISTSVSLGEQWQSAVTNHNPVFAYANIERKTQLASDLVSYFEGLLALGGAFERLRADVSERGRGSRLSFEAWQTARSRASAAVAAIDSERHNASQVNLPTITFPSIEDSIDTWLVDNMLDVSGESRREIETGFAAEILDKAQAATTSLAKLRTAADSLGQSLAAELEALHASAGQLEIRPDPCPVCMTPDVDWFGNLALTVASLQALQTARTSATTAVESLSRECDGRLSDLLHLAVEDDQPAQLGQGFQEGLGLLTGFLSVRRSSGLQLGQPLQTAAEALAKWIKSPAGASAIAYGVLQSERTHQWKLQRTEAVSEFVDTWRLHGETGSGWPLWQETAKRVDELKDTLRKSRSQSLVEITDKKVNELLSDVGLGVGSIRVLTTKAEFELLDSSGARVDLGMLSAGQRNAVLLAPLIAAAEAGPFGFLVLDDPVHAFDELRVDHLARALGGVARDRRVLVLTHDERLREHLLALPGVTNSHLVHRNAVDGRVELRDSTNSWDVLLADARDVLKSAAPVPGTALSVTDMVRGFCRQALDAALRTFVIRNAVGAGRSISVDLECLDKVNTTNDRLKAATKLEVQDPLAPSSVATAISTISPYFTDWNRASHGNLPRSAATEREIDAALSACSALSQG